MRDLPQQRGAKSDPICGGIQEKDRCWEGEEWSERLKVSIWASVGW